jgi:hypothetical protein
MLPKIARPCPYLDRLDSVIEDDFCRMCHREVHDLTGMDERARDAFIADCGGDVCISFTGFVRPALAAAAIAASAAVLVTPGAALACDGAKQEQHRAELASTLPMSTAPLPPPMVQVRTAGLPPPPIKLSPPAAPPPADGKPAESRKGVDLDPESIAGG